MARPVLGHGPVPVRHGYVRTAVLQRLFEFIKIDTVPGQEALPSVLAMVLVDQRQVVVVARILRPLVQFIKFPKGKAQLLPLRVIQASNVHALPQLAVLVFVFVYICGWLRLVLGCGIYMLANRFRGCLRLPLRDLVNSNTRVFSGTAGINPIADLLNIFFSNGFPLPGKLRELRTVERRLPAKPANQPGARPASGSGFSFAVTA